MSLIQVGNIQLTTDEVHLPVGIAYVLSVCCVCVCVCACALTVCTNLELRVRPYRLPVSYQPLPPKMACPT
jgi:hypothetical protein